MLSLDFEDFVKMFNKRSYADVVSGIERLVHNNFNLANFSYKDYIMFTVMLIKQSRACIILYLFSFFK